MTTENAEQAAHWNNPDEVGQWVTYQANYDRMLAAFSTMLFGEARLVAGERVLDVGCGCGATTRDAARLVAPGEVVGVDLSTAMLDRARDDTDAAGLTNAAFTKADAQVYPFAPASFDVVISRFGVMFFADPVAAFTNLHRAAATDGRLVFVSWQSLAENEWLQIPRAALAEQVALPPVPPGVPGMLALADPDHTRTILEAAGWRDVTITPQRTRLLLGGGGTVDDSIEFLRSGSLFRTLLAGADPDTATRALDHVRDTLAAHAGPEGVELGAAVWVVAAKR